MTLRDRMAMVALPTILAKADLSCFDDETLTEAMLQGKLNIMALDAYMVADAMLRERMVDQREGVWGSRYGISWLRSHLRWRTS